jgi:hypothetical protein
MVKRLRVRRAALLAVLLAALAPMGCDLFTVTPFPGYLEMTDSSIDLGARIDAIAAGSSPVSYDLTVVTAAGLPPRLLLLVEPPSSDPTVGFNYRGQLIFLDQDLTALGQAKTKTSLDYFGKPYSYAADGNILSADTVLTPDGADTVTGTVNPPHGLEGFAFKTKPPVTLETDVFASPSGKYTSFDLSCVGYDTIWGNVLTKRSLAIIPDAARPSSSDPNYANLGYQLVGLAYNDSSDQITFVLSEPAQGRIVAARIDRASATSGSGVLLPAATAWPVPASAWPVSVDVDRPALAADPDGFFLVRRDGWMERYAWTASGTLSLSGAAVRVAGDRSLSRRYAFLVPQTAGQPSYMYRFDPSSRILTRYRRWW